MFGKTLFPINEHLKVEVAETYRKSAGGKTYYDAHAYVDGKYLLHSLVVKGKSAEEAKDSFLAIISKVYNCIND